VPADAATPDDLGRLKPTRYRGRADLGLFLAFASRSTAARAPLGAQWHPGDMAWQMRSRYECSQALYGFEARDGFGAVAWFQAPGEMLLEVMPSAEEITEPLLAWALDKARAAPAPMQASELRITVFDSDLARQERLAHAGFRRAGPAGVHFERSLGEAPPAPEPPPGIQIRDCVGVDAHARSAAHRDAWSALEHLGIDGRSDFSAAEYLSLLTSGAYDPVLDMVAEAEDGRLVANAIAWLDPASGVGIFEPVGVNPHHRGQGLAGAAMLEGMHRLRAAGARLARVGTAHFNASAIAAYQRNFELVDRSSTWSHTIED